MDLRFCGDPKIPIDAFTNFLTLRNVPYCVALIQLTHDLAFRIRVVLSLGVCECVRVSVCLFMCVHLISCACVSVYGYERTHYTSRYCDFTHDSSNFIDSNNKTEPYRSCQIVRQSSQHNTTKSCQLSSRNIGENWRAKKRRTKIYTEHGWSLKINNTEFCCCCFFYSISLSIFDPI